MSSSLVLSGFRRLSRSAKAMFGSDLYALGEAKKALKSEFRRNKNVTDKNLLGISYV